MKVATIAVLAALFIFRAPTAIRTRSARPAWLASGFGLLGLTTIGVLIPLPVVDAPLGGTNLILLVRTTAAVIAFWFLRDAIAIETRQVHFHRSKWVLLILLAAQAAVFFGIPTRGASTINFVNEHLQGIWGCLWVTVYSAQLAWVAFESAWLVRTVWKGVFSPFLLGSLAIGVGCISEIAYAGAVYFHAVTPGSQDLFSLGFDDFFYPGVFLIATGFLVIVIGTRQKQASWRLRCIALTGILRRRAEGIERPSQTALVRSAFAREPVVHAYDAVIEIRNLQAMRRITLAERELRVVSAAEHAFEGFAVLEPFKEGGAQ